MANFVGDKIIVMFCYTHYGTHRSKSTFIKKLYFVGHTLLYFCLCLCCEGGRILTWQGHRTWGEVARPMLAEIPRNRMRHIIWDYHG